MATATDTEDNSALTDVLSSQLDLELLKVFVTCNSDS